MGPRFRGRSAAGSASERRLVSRWLFASDLHGRVDRYQKLLRAVREQRPEAVLLGGDLLPHAGLAAPGGGDFLAEWLLPTLEELRSRLGSDYPRLLVVFGNDDPRAALASLAAIESRGLAEHVHGRRVEVSGRVVYGYACVPPTPFRLKDWERYDVSRFVDPGGISPEEGVRTVPAEELDTKWGTIASDLARLTADQDLARVVFLFHAPPYRTALDRAGLDGRSVDHARLDVHVGSIAVRRFIEARQPLLTLHGHVHESARLTGSWRERIGRTVCLSAAHDGPELALVELDPDDPGGATRRLV
jgi:Icc-related predicted phosphoesterase